MNAHADFRFHRLALTLVAVATWLLLSSCETGILDEDRPLSVELELLEGNLQTEEELLFRAQATGSQLGMLVIRFGDGLADSLLGRGANFMQRRVHHSYEAPGTYRVEATVLDLMGSTVSDRVELQIQDVGPSPTPAN